MKPVPDECECFVTPEKYWLSAASCGYGGGYEPGSQMEWNPDCPVHGEPRATPCPACGGAGIVDTSPPGVEQAPWLQTDMDCGACGGSGEIDPNTYEPDIEESP